uniref:Uncharacterized protein n=1 Tax=Parascaris univalens TaxID=6257 RepID=A0A915AJQ1_PARUN
MCVWDKYTLKVCYVFAPSMVVSWSLQVLFSFASRDLVAVEVYDGVGDARGAGGDDRSLKIVYFSYAAISASIQSSI